MRREKEIFEILLLLDVVVTLIVETMDQDAMKKKMNSFRMGDMVRSVYEM